MATSELEREVKLEVDGSFEVPELPGAAAGFAPGRSPDVRLAARYFDTADLRLLRRGISLRHRRDLSGDGEDGWTLKLPARTDRAVLARRELAWPGGLDREPSEALALVRGIVRRAPLALAALLRSERRRLVLVDPSGAPMAELDDDTVTVVRGARQGLTFRQIEVEQLGADDALFEELVARLTAAGARRGRQEPKLLRAVGPPPEPLRPQDLGPASNLGQVVVAAVAAGAGRLLDHDVGIRLGDGDTEFVHQARVATRRLRSDLRTFRGVLDPSWVDGIRAELQWLGGALGAVRDADVLGANLQDLDERAGGGDEAGFGEIMAALRLQRDDADSTLREALDSDRYLDLLDRLEDAVGHPPFVGRSGPLDPGLPAADVLPGLLRGPWRRLRKAAVGAGRRPDDAQLHRVRIRAKQLRYAAEAAAPVFGSRARQLAQGAEALQTVLGEQHDAVTAAAWLSETGATGSPTRAVAARRLAEQARRRQEDRRAAWRPAWRRFDRVAVARWLEGVGPEPVPPTPRPGDSASVS